MNRRILLVSLLLLLMATSCNLPTAALLPGSSAGSEILVTLNPEATATSTPFGPQPPTETPAASPTAIPPTPTATVDPSRPWGDFPGPVEPSAIDIRPPAEPIAFAPNVVNIVLLGSDARPYTGGYRTDVIMLVSLDPNKGTATLLSLPRDLYVYIPGWRVDRINTAEPRGGFEMLYNTILYNFGIPVQHWARMNFSGFIQAVNTLGGVDVLSTGYLYDECGGVWYTYRSGVTYHMDGWTAHCYVRMRHTSSDFDRLRREQEVIQAIFNKTVSLNGLTRVPELYSNFSSMLQTDVTLNAALPLVPLGATLATDSSRIRRFAVDSSLATGWRVPYSGASVLLPNWDLIEEMLATAFPQ